MQTEKRPHNKSPLRILVVCYGNTCRSPMFERILSAGLWGCFISNTVESAGMLVESAEGQPAAAEAIQCLGQHYSGIENHKSRYIGSLPDLSVFDRVYCFEEKFVPGLIKFGIPTHKIKVYELPNPWQKGLQAYYECAQAIGDFIPEIIEDLKTINN